MNSNVVKKFYEHFEIEDNNCQIDSSSYGEKFNVIEYTDEAGTDVKYIIADYVNGAFEFADYEKMMENEEGLSIPVMVFNNWQQERDVYWSQYDCLGADEKKKLDSWFTKKESIYMERKESIFIRAEDKGINYLQYNSKNESLKGFIYNISFIDLHKIYNVTGTSLFNYNVRNGIKKDTIGEGIRKKFRDYINLYCYQRIIEMKPGIDKDELQNSLDLLDPDIEVNGPDNFWFYHNGITIFSYDDVPIDRSGDLIKLNPKKISVINGAQTLTNFLNEVDNAKHGLHKKILELTPEEAEAILNEVLEVVKVKTILIEGDLKCVKPITHGLNTQIPIFKEDILATSETVQILNDVLKKYGVKILKTGEVSILGNGYTPIEFAKKYLIIKEKPGKSKNLNKKEIEIIIRQAKKELKSNEKGKYFALLDAVDSWWKASAGLRKEGFDSDSNEIIIAKYAKNYFESYLVKLKESNADDENLWRRYTDFLSLLADQTLESAGGDFKNDDLFKSATESLAKRQNSLRVHEIDEDDLVKYIQENKRSPYSLSKTINEYLRDKEITDMYFRVVNRVDGTCKEAFPFPNTTFSEMFTDVKSYGESLFCEAVKREFPLFVIENEKYKDELRIEKIHYLKDFSFARYSEQAKKVYNLTLKAFEDGEEAEFPKISDSLYFHVRPKAINADDTFEFTNGKQITKRTFWANKTTVDAIINERVGD